MIAPIVQATVLDLLRDLGAALSASGLRWYLFGAQAAIFHGSSRLSADVDATVMMEPEQADSLLGTLATRGIVPRNVDFRNIAAKHRVLLLWHERTGMPLDLVLGGTGIEEEFCDRARVHELGGFGIPVISAEDLVASKILAGRGKDLDDVRAIMLASKDALDSDRVAEILRQFEQALDRGDLLSTFEEISSRRR